MWQTTPSKSSRMCDIVLWKTSGAELMPKGRRLKQYRPKGVINVVRSQEFGSSGICQNPELASSLLKYLLFWILARFSSTDAIGCTSLRTALFSGVRSTQSRISLLDFGTTTNPEHHSVGSLTFEITSSCSILANFSLTSGRRG